MIFPLGRKESSVEILKSVFEHLLFVIKTKVWLDPEKFNRKSI